MSTQHPGLKVMAERLTSAGYKKRAGLVFTRDLGDDVLGWVGLNTASHQSAAGEVLVNPVVGVRHQAVEDLIAEGMGNKPHPYSPPTYSQPLSSVAADIGPNDFVLTGDDSDAATAGAIVDAVTAHGAKFMSQYVDRGTLAARLGELAANDQAARVRQPVLLMLLGDDDAAAAAHEAAQDMLAGRTDRASETQREFFEWLSRRLREQVPQSR